MGNSLDPKTKVMDRIALEIDILQRAQALKSKLGHLPECSLKEQIGREIDSVLNIDTSANQKHVSVDFSPDTTVFLLSLIQQTQEEFIKRIKDNCLADVDTSPSLCKCLEVRYPTTQQVERLLSTMLTTLKEKVVDADPESPQKSPGR
jgi:hypothetical protein